VYNNGKFVAIAPEKVGVHLVTSTININCPFGRWLPRVP